MIGGPHSVVDWIVLNLHLLSVVSDTPPLLRVPAAFHLHGIPGCRWFVIIPRRFKSSRTVERPGHPGAGIGFRNLRMACGARGSACSLAVYGNRTREQLSCN